MPSKKQEQQLLDLVAADARRLETLDGEGEPLRWALAEHVAEANDSGLSYKAIAERALIGPGRIAAYAAAFRKFGDLPASHRPRMADALVLAGREPSVAAAIAAVAEARGVQMSTVDKSIYDRRLVNETRERLRDPKIAEMVLADPSVARTVARSVVEDASADAEISTARGQRDTREAKEKQVAREAAGGNDRDHNRRSEASNWLATLGRLSAARRALRKAMETVEPSELDQDSRDDLIQWAEEIVAAATSFKTYVANGDTGSIDRALAALLGE